MPEDEQQEEIEQPQIGYFAPPQSLSDETIRWQLDPTDVIDELRYYLKAFTKKDDGWEKNDFNAQPKMTEEGVNSYMGILRSYLNKNVVLSNLSEDEIIEIMKDLCKTLRLFLVGNYKAYKIQKKDFSEIYHNTENQIYMFLLRAKNNGERLRWMKTQTVNEVKQTFDERPKKRFGVI